MAARELADGTLRQCGMRKIRLPPKLKSTTAEAKWLNTLLEAVTHMVPLQTVDADVSITTRGTMIVPKRRQVKAGEGGGLRFRGEWSAAEVYAVDDIVVVRGGVSAGSYICIQSVGPAGDPSQVPSWPDVGVYWVSLGRGNTGGQWS